MGARQTGAGRGLPSLPNNFDHASIALAHGLVGSFTTGFSFFFVRRLPRGMNRVTHPWLRRPLFWCYAHGRPY